MSKVLALTTDDLGRGFALAGIDVAEAPDAAAVGERLLDVIEGGEYGVVIISTQVRDQFDPRLRETIDKTAVPLILAVPADMKWGESEGIPEDEQVARLIKAAVGYQLNVNL